MAGARRAAAAREEPELAPPPLDTCTRNTIETALAAPRAGFGGHDKYPDLESKAAVLLYTLAKCQACTDGNKRLALILVEAFLALNDCTTEAEPTDVHERINGAAESERDHRDQVLHELTDWLRHVIRPLETRASP